jgi:hypothetical protein
VSTRALRRTLAGTLLCLALWPAAHLGLARRCGIDPWELFGWAMYTTPTPRLGVEVREWRDGEARPLPVRFSTLERIERFRRSRLALGCLAPAEPFARELLAREPAAAGIELTLRRHAFDPATARFATREERVRVAR